MSDFVFTLKVKTAKPSAVHPGRLMIVIESNVRIPDGALNRAEYAWPDVILERLRNNHVIIVHTRMWGFIGDVFLKVLVNAPSNSRRHFPAQVIIKERGTGRVVEWVQYPIIYNW